MAALSATEQLVMGLWDEGMGSDEIARHLRLRRVRVRRIIKYFGGADHARRERAAMTLTSAMLATAIQQARAPHDSQLQPAQPQLGSM